jgi:cytochrome c peroxidase
VNAARRGAVVLGVLASLAACDDPSTRSTQPARLDQRTDLEREPLLPLPRPPSLDPALVELGRSLFDDKRLASDGSVACSTCHDLAKGGADGLAHSVGAGGRPSPVNAPTVLNAGLNIAQFWDGRAPTLEAQIDGPIRVEMGSSWDAVITKLRADPDTVAAFARARQPLSPDGVRGAIAAFERTLVTRGSPFDRWLDGDAAALTAEQSAGYETFKSVGCIACHQGANVGGNMFQPFGVMGDYFADRGHVVEADYGRYNVTHAESDRFRLSRALAPQRREDGALLP